MLIRTKETMYRLLGTGRFGNYPRSWKSLEAVAADGFRGEVSVRSLEIANPVRLYHILAVDLPGVVATLPPEQRNPGLVFSESMPEEQHVIQGEYDGENLTYTFAKAPMRIAFDRQRLVARGAVARWTLETYLEANDLDWLLSLVCDFPGAVVEFSAFRCPVGTVKGSRCVFWEVRHY
jgi:hypothetical protein